MKDEILSRRVVLRGVLAAGCSLLVPLTLFSSRASGAEAAATAKMPKASVQYQTQPKGEQSCGKCAHFNAEAKTCDLVDGPISPEGWCSMWAKKA